VVTQPENSGYSRALIDGFAACHYEAIFYTDADAQFDLRHIADLYPDLAEADMVAGFRVDRQDEPIRLLTSGVYNWLQSRMLGIRVKDVNCAFKLFRRSFFDRVELSSEGFLIDAELYARAQQAGLTWRQVGVPHRPRPSGSTTVSVSTVFETLRELRALKKRLEGAAKACRQAEQEGSISSQ
jgi:glycosyltransferase involved in cell wall biosynthesis